MEEDDYWNTSDNKAYSFEDVDIFNSGSSRNRTSFNKLLLEDNASEASYDLPQNDLNLDSIISYHDLQMILEEQTLSAELRVPKGLPAEDELKLLRRQTFGKQSPERAISTLLFGQQTSLEGFKSISDKELLIDLAIDSGNGNAILYVVLFLEESLNQSLFHQVLRQRPVAANHYKKYLCSRGNSTQKCCDFLTMLGLHNEAAMVHFTAVVKSGQGRETKRQRIKSIYNDYFSQPGTSPFLSEMVASYLNLMNWQAGEQGPKNHPDLVGESTLRSLFHCSRSHHWPDGAAPASVNNPFAFAKQYQVLDGQFEYVVLVERSLNEAWMDLESIFEKKSLLKKAFQMQLPLDRVIMKLFQLKAPQGTLFYFLNQTTDLQRRLTLSRSVQCPKSVIDCYVGLKLRSDLAVYKDSLPGGSPERFYADKCLAKLKQ